MSDVRTGNETQKSFYTGKREITPYADDHVQKPTFLSAYVELSERRKEMNKVILMGRLTRDPEEVKKVWTQALREQGVDV